MGTPSFQGNRFFFVFCRGVDLSTWVDFFFFRIDHGGWEVDFFAGFFFPWNGRYDVKIVYHCNVLGYDLTVATWQVLLSTHLTEIFTENYLPQVNI